MSDSHDQSPPSSSPLSAKARAHKVNALINQLPESQRALINERLSRSAPQLIPGRAGEEARVSNPDGSLDTPMKRARSLARSLLKRERAARIKRERLGIDAPESHGLYGEGPDRSERELVDPFADEEATDVDSHRPLPPMINLRRLDATSLLKVYQTSKLSEWLSALKIADPELKEHLLFSLPLGLASELEEALRSLGPLRLAEAQAAERLIMSRARALESRGEIRGLSQADV